MEVHPTAVAGVLDISEAPGCHLSQQMSSQWGSQKLLQGLLSQELKPTFVFLTYLNLVNYGRIIKCI